MKKRTKIKKKRLAYEKVTLKNGNSISFARDPSNLNSLEGIKVKRTFYPIPLLKKVNENTDKASLEISLLLLGKFGLDWPKYSGLSKPYAKKIKKLRGVILDLFLIDAFDKA